jgi:hypothetical protein
MDKRIITLFSEAKTVQKIQNKLPKLFQLAELESQRAGRVGMEVGSIRERIIVSLLIYRFGEENVYTNIPITEPEIDVKLFGLPISIKTKTGTNLSGVKISWTVDAKNAAEFQKGYSPSCDMIFVQINWEKTGYLFYFPVEIQLDILKFLGKERYIKLPSEGTNPRGVELSSEALKLLTEHKNCFKVPIEWKKEEMKFNAFKRWVDLWAQE